jgi:hypothetical protein
MQGPLRRLWISPPHVDARGNEIRLLAYAKQRSRLHALKREVFTEIGPDELIDEARAFPFQRAAISPTA